MKEIIVWYKNFKKDFEKEDLNYFVTESILELLEVQKVELSDLTSYIEKNKERLRENYSILKAELTVSTAYISTGKLLF